MKLTLGAGVEAESLIGRQKAAALSRDCNFMQKGTELHYQST